MKNIYTKQDLMPKGVSSKIPPLYAQEAKGMDAIAYVKYFAGHKTWYCTEYDPETQELFGIVYSSMCPDGELGYTSLKELAELKVGLIVVERDIHFKPTPLKDCKNT